MKYILFLGLFFTSFSFAQTRLTGIVVDAKSAALPGVSVFLNNTSIGTITDAKGYFELSIPTGKFELIVTSVGFATFQQLITSETKSPITVTLTPKAKELNEVVIGAFEKNGWKKWGNWFYEQFIGATAIGSACKIKNPEVIRFRLSEKNKLMTVMAKEPLIIENKELGYRIKYQLELFQYEFGAGRLFYAGFPFFEQLKGSVRQLKKWEAAREDAYYGSVTHFMRALFLDSLAKEGYDMRVVIKTPNVEKQRVKEMYRKSLNLNSGKINFGGDSSSYYNRILQQQDVKSEIGRTLLSRDSVGQLTDSAFVLNNTNYLWVYYKNKPLPAAYIQLFPGPGTAWVSEFLLVNKVPVEVYSNGSYFSPTDLVFSGFWAWREKVRALLPVNYKK